jgi:hypothetical protein
MICLVLRAFETQKKNQILMGQVVRYGRDVLFCIACAMPSYLWLANKGLIEQATPFMRQAAMLLFVSWAFFYYSDIRKIGVNCELHE